ncbi:MAG: lysophospholipid acyltransferase family protein [Oligoflexales bacterium]
MYYFLKWISALLGLLSSAGLDKLAKVVGFVSYNVLGVRKNLVHRNLATAFPNLSPEQTHAVAGKAYYNFAATVLELLANKDTRAVGDCQFVGRENMEKALEKGKGAFVLCAHLGNWEVLGAAVNNKIRTVRVVVKKVGSDSVDRFVDEKRTEMGMLTIKRRGKMDAIREIQKALRSNWVVGMVLDQSRPDEPRLPFFGKPAKTNSSLASMWSRFDSPVIPTYICRRGINSHTIHFLPELQKIETGSREDDIIENSKMFNRTLEEMITKNPEQYFWLHDRWK